jgi:RNA polymerase sigma factor (sigma-70 family)
MTPPPEPPDFPASQLFLRRLAYHLVRDEARAEDLVQETWAAWVEHKPSGVAEPRAWLARVLRNRAFNQKRADERRELREGLAGRPDVSAPETDGTLEAQAQLVEALRKLEEPFRSALVQRYYHDLAPREIAERSGAPVNTVKARLARGLEKLRAEMDRRYRGDRKAWCHWLTVVGAPPLVPAIPGGSGTPAGVGAGAGTSLLTWTGVALVVAAGTVLRGVWSDEPRGPGSGPPREPFPVSDETRAEEPASRPSTTRPAEKGPEEGAAHPAAKPVQPPVSGVAPRPGGSALPAALVFDWPQFAGGPSHDTTREREDGIHSPKVLWFLPGLHGAPSLRDGELYAGGLLLARVDPLAGEPLGATSPSVLEVRRKAGEDGPSPNALAALQEDVERELEKGVDPEELVFAGAPVVLEDLVIVRDLADGSVRAFDRSLEKERWRIHPTRVPEKRPASARVPLCLAEEDTLLVVTGSELVALRAADGTERWRFHVNGQIHAPPAAASGRVFVGADKGQFFGLSVSTGERLWQVQAGAFGSGAPVVIGSCVFAADQGRMPWQEPGEERTDQSASGTLHLFDVRSGAEMWRLRYRGTPVSALAMFESGSQAVAGLGEEIARLDLGQGKLSSTHLRAGERLSGVPAVVGEDLVFACERQLDVHDLATLELRWAFRAPKGVEVQDFVHTGERIYVATSIGLVCLGDDGRRAPERGFVLEWERGEGPMPVFLPR